MSPKSSPNPLTSLRVSKHFIAARGLIPNTSIQYKPLLIYHAAFPVASTTTSSIEEYVNSIGVVVPEWRYSMYSTTHFHSTTHEVLCVVSGSARCCFGGEDNPERVEPVIEKGDVVVIPAGVGHRLLDDFGSGFQMVGCYPKGKKWDMCYGKREEEQKIKAIKELEWFQKDPIYGGGKPAPEV